MKRGIDDAKLTAYALGELADGERASIEAYLSTRPRQRQWVEDARSAAALVSGALRREAGGADAGLDAARRAALLDAIGGAPAPADVAVAAGRNQMLRQAAASVHDQFGPTPVYHVLTHDARPSRWRIGRLAGLAAAVAVGATTVGLLLRSSRPAEYAVHPTPPLSFPAFPADGGVVHVGDPNVPTISLGTVPALDRVVFSPAFDAADAAGPAAFAFSRAGTSAAAPEPAAVGVAALAEGPGPRPRSARDDARFIAMVRRNAPRSPMPPFHGSEQTSFALRIDVPPEVTEEYLFRLRQIQSSLIHPAQTLQQSDDLARRVHSAARAAVVGRGAADDPAGKPCVDVGPGAVSTFDLNVPSHSYAALRRLLMAGQSPPRDGVRIEEMLNYFPYAYPAPAAEPITGQPPAAVALSAEVAACPWNPAHRLLRVGVRAREETAGPRPPCTLVFVVDVSAAMDAPSRLPAVKAALAEQVGRLTDADSFGLVTYGSGGIAGSVALAPTAVTGANRAAILRAINDLSAGGIKAGASADGGALELAFRLAGESAKAPKGADAGPTRVVLASCGDWNVSPRRGEELRKTIQSESIRGTYLSALDFGPDTLFDPTMEWLGNRAFGGDWAYLDTPAEARRAVRAQARSTPTAVATRVAIQAELMPGKVKAYRLLGYETPAAPPAPAPAGDGDDAADVWREGRVTRELLAGHTTTALYEIVPGAADAAGPLAVLRLRYWEPGGGHDRLIELPVTDAGTTADAASADFKFAAAVASLGLILRDSPQKGDATLERVIRLAEQGKGADELGLRGEFVEMVKRIGK